ncbi:MAG TPA: phosphate signaling complex protein PhoU [Planctomycetota bacterium]|jgi:phosphate transport system protein|nr:phosphate signaling complex protein PhoU [Planctomycetota bacterium]
MSAHRKFDDALAALKSKVVAMGEVAQTMIHQSMKALVDRDAAIIQLVLENEDKLDRYQVEIDNDAIRLMALQSPVAQDLRFVLMVARINTELERIGDLCVNLCESVQLLLAEPPLKPLVDLPKMASTAERMVEEALQAFLQGTTEKALQVIKVDDEVDALNDQIFRELLTYMLSDPRNITRALALILMARNLERVADHGTNIAEEVVYLVKGEDIRHQHPGGEKSKLQ